MDTAKGIKEELGIPEVPNVKYEPQDQSHESRQLKISNVFSINTELVRESFANLEETNRFSITLMKKGLVKESPNDLPLKSTTASTTYDFTMPPERIKIFCKNLDKPDGLLLLQRTQQKIQGRSLKISTVTKPIAQYHEDLDAPSRSPNTLAERTSVTTSNDQLTNAIFPGRNIILQSSNKQLQPQYNSPSPIKINLPKLQRVRSCDFCSLLFFSVESLEEHVADTHVEDKEFDCTQCDKSFISQERLDSHMAEHEKGHEAQSGNRCPVCSKIFLKRKTLKRHIIAHQAERPFKCKFCPNSYVQRKALDAHQMNQHGKPKTFKCPKCPKSFVQNSVLEDHILTHSSDKTIVCVSNKYFKTKADLTDHRPHCQGPNSTDGLQATEPDKYEKTKYLECSICAKKFAHRWSLHRHKLTHLTVRPLECKFCPKSFVTSRVLEIHEMNRHGKPKPFKCPNCPKSYARNCTLKDHLRTHSDEKTIVCRNCNEAFKTKATLNHHRPNCKAQSDTQGSKRTELGKDEKNVGS